MSKSSEIAFIFLTNNRNLSGFELYFNAKNVFFIYIYTILALLRLYLSFPFYVSDILRSLALVNSLLIEK